MNKHQTQHLLQMKTRIYKDAIAAGNAALAQHVPETDFGNIAQPEKVKPWVGLTDEEIDKCFEFIIEDITQAIRFYQAIEAKLKEKNT